MTIATGNFLTGTGAVSTTVVETGLDFTPKCIIFMTEDGFGVAVGTSNRWTVTMGKRSSTSSGDDGSYGTNDACIAHMTNDTTLNGKLDLQSFDSNGFTLVVDDQFATSESVDYIAFSKGDFDTGVLTEPGATGNQSVTSTSFTPNGVIFGTASKESHNVVDTGRHMAIGIATGASNRGWANQGVSNKGSDCGTCNNYSVAAGGLSLTECLGAMRHTFNTRNNDSRADFVSFNSNGFTINWLERKASHFHYWLAMNLDDVHMNSFQTRTDLSNESVLTPGFPPDAIFFLSDSAFAGEAYTFGWATGALDRGCSWRNWHDNASSGSGGGATGVWGQETTMFYKHVDNGGSTVAEADLVTIDPLGFTFKMDDADSVNRNVAFMAFGDSGPGNQILLAGI